MRAWLLSWFSLLDRKSLDRQFVLSHCFVIWQAHRQQCCRSACQISDWSDNSKYKSCGLETSRDLTIRRLIWYWIGPSIRITVDLSSINRMFLNISWKLHPSYTGLNVYIVGYISLLSDSASEQILYSENIPVKKIYIYIYIRFALFHVCLAMVC